MLASIIAVNAILTDFGGIRQYTRQFLFLYLLFNLT